MHTIEPVSALQSVMLGWGFVGSDGVLHRDALFREMSGDEEDLLADRSSSFVTRTKHIFFNCLQRLGTIEDRKELLRAVEKLTSSDRMQVMLHLRRISLGDLYKMTVECERCHRESTKHIDLSKVDVKHPEFPEKRIYEDSLPSGALAEWEVMCGSQEEITSKIREYETSTDSKHKRTNKDLEQSRISFAMWMRMISIDGHKFSRSFPTDVDGVPVVNMEEIAMIKRMPTRDRLWLRQRIEAVEAGPDLKFEYRCDNPDCKRLQTATLDISQPEFFFPSVI
jgi:hypothetical protein